MSEGVQSWPTAWIENTGNDVAIMDLSISNLPNGWSLSGEGVVVVAPVKSKVSIHKSSRMLLGMEITFSWTLN